MTPDHLLIALAERDIRIVPEGGALRFAGPRGAMTEALMADLSKHKMLLIAVFATLRKRQCDGAWETVREWVADGPPGPVPPAVIAAGKKVGVQYGEREWPGGYAERLKMALRVHALLAVFNDPSRASGGEEPPVVIATEGGERHAGAA